MKKRYLILCFLFSITFYANAQFEGVLTYEIGYESDDEKMKEYIDAFPKSSTLHIKNEMMRFDQDLAGGGQQSFISNTETMSMSMLMRFMGRDFQVNLKAEEIDQLEQAQQLKIVKTNRTRDISGYTCNHAYAISESDSLSIFYTESIKTGNIVPQFADLDGLPLYYEMNRGKVHMTYNCTVIDKSPVELSVFTISQSVKEIPFDDFARSFAVLK